MFVSVYKYRVNYFKWDCLPLNMSDYSAGQPYELQVYKTFLKVLNSIICLDFPARINESGLYKNSVYNKFKVRTPRSHCTQTWFHIYIASQRIAAGHLIPDLPS